MTLDEAIKEFMECAKADRKEQNYWASERDETSPLSNGECVQLAEDCETRAEYNEQLAKWLTELKQWRRVYGICPNYEMCIPECKEGYNAQIAEYKRLLKAAIEDIHELLCDKKNLDGNGQSCNICSYIEWCPCCKECTIRADLRNWRYADEALKLIGDEPNGI